MTIGDLQERPVPPGERGGADRRYVALPGGDVHLRSWTSGLPPVLLLHDSPGSAAALVVQAAELATGHDVYLPDLPGHGGTTVPPSPDGTIAPTNAVTVAAAAVLSTIEQLGLTGVALCGVGFGALVADAVAERLGDACRGALVFRPGASPGPTVVALGASPAGPGGGHLLDSWWLLRQATMFREWWKAEPTGRFAAVPSSADDLHEVWVDILGAAPTSPAVDPSWAASDRWPKLPEWTATAIADALRQAPGALAGLPPARVRAPRDGVRCSYLRAGGGVVHLRRTTAPTAGPTGRRPWVILPTLPGSSASVLPLLEVFAGSRDVVAIDYPGHGRSDPMPPDRGALDDYVDVLEDVAGQLELGGVNVLGSHSGALLAIYWQRRYPDRVAALALDGVPLGAAFAGWDLDRYLPDLRPEADGQHLLRAWAMATGRGLWSPWYDASPGTAIDGGPASPEQLTSWAVDLLRGARSYHWLYRLVLSSALEDQPPPARTVSTLLCLTTGDHLTKTHARAAELMPHAITRETFGHVDRVTATRTAAVLTDFADHLEHTLEQP